jgi:hypothetical protein
MVMLGLAIRHSASELAPITVATSWVVSGGETHCYAGITGTKCMSYFILLTQNFLDMDDYLDSKTIKHDLLRYVN